MESDHLQQFLAEIEERICTCGAGHGSGEGHTDWCEWVEEYSCPPAPEAQQESVVVSVADIKAWRAEWMDANDPQDGTDCVTPFDKYLYTRPTPSVARLRDALEHVTELLVDTWDTKMEDDPELQVAVKNARALLRAKEVQND